MTQAHDTMKPSQEEPWYTLPVLALDACIHGAIYAGGMCLTVWHFQWLCEGDWGRFVSAWFIGMAAHTLIREYIKRRRAQKEAK